MSTSRSITWYPAGVDPLAPDGSEIELQGDGGGPFREVSGSSGFFAAPWDLLSDSTPGVDGGQLREVRKTARDPSYRFECRTVDEGEFARSMQGLAAALTSSRAPGTLVVGTREGTTFGDVRMIRCIYADGLQGDSLLGRNARVKWWPFTLRFRAFDPCWYSMEPAVATWTGKAATPFFGGGSFFPWTLAPYGMDEAVALDLSGDTDSWPTFTLGAPFLRARFTNDRTGLSWEVVRGNEDQWTDLVVETKPGSADVLTSTGEKALSQRTAVSRFFPLAAGDTVSVQTEGSTTATRFDMTVWPAWNTAP